MNNDPWLGNSTGPYQTLGAFNAAQIVGVQNINYVTNDSISSNNGVWFFNGHVSKQINGLGIFSSQAAFNASLTAGQAAIGLVNGSLYVSKNGITSLPVIDDVKPNANNKIIYFGDSFVGRSLSAGGAGLAGFAPSLAGFPLWVQFLSAGKLSLYGILGFSGYRTDQLLALLPTYAQYLSKADYIFAQGGINDDAATSVYSTRIQMLEAYWSGLSALGPQLVVPTINIKTTNTVAANSTIMAINDYIIKQGKKGRFIVVDIYKRLTQADGSFSGTMRTNSGGSVPHVATLGAYYYAHAIVDEFINQIPWLTPAPRATQDLINPYVINNNSGLIGNVASGAANANTLLTTLTGTLPYQWSAANYGAGVAGSCNVTTVDAQVSNGNIPVSGQQSYTQWNFSFTTTQANTGIQISQSFGMVTGHTWGAAQAVPQYAQGWFWNYNGNNTFRALVPYGTTATTGAGPGPSSWSAKIGEVSNDGAVYWQTIPFVGEGTVITVSVRIQLLTNPLNVPMQLNLSLAADNSNSSTHQAKLFLLNCEQEVDVSSYVTGVVAQGLDGASDYLPFGTGEEFLITSLPFVLRDPIGGGGNLQGLYPLLQVLSTTASASAITFAIRDFEVRVIGQKPTANSSITYY